MKKLMTMFASGAMAIASFADVPEALIHRWSFNNSLEDTGSIGGMTATLGGNAALTDDGTSVRLTRDGDPVELGANPIPSDLGDTPFTIEVWATFTASDNYRGMFSLGERSDRNAKGLMGVFQGYRQINYTGGSGGEYGPVWQAVAGTVNGGIEKNVAMTPGGISTGTPYYFAYVVTPTGDGSATVAGYVYNVSTGAQVGKSVMYTVTDWTTAQLAQSWFGLGTTPWGDATPGADYDEVRVWKKALTPADVAANVKAGPDAIPGDGDYPVLGVSEATLAHRWSFNGSLVDSVTEDVATMQGASYTADGVRFTGGSKAANYVSLGAYKMPSDSVTLEFFSTTRTLGWPKMFCLGNGGSETDGISFSYARVDGTGLSGIEIYGMNGGHWIGRITNALEVNKPYHFIFTFSCDGTDTVVSGYCIDLTNPGTIRGQFTETLSGWRMTESISLDTFNLAWSFWGGDNAPSADFDEVRVWDGVLSATEILASSRAGADAVITTESASDAVLFEYDFTGGVNSFSSDIVGDPVVNDASYLAVHGTSGYGTAVHPAGYGPISLGETYLNDDWTLAMSFKSCDVENGILLALGGNGMASIGRELRILSSSTSGKLSAVIAQTWSLSYNQNLPPGSGVELTDLGDTIGSFHTLVAVHTKDDAKIKLYWDGVYKGWFNSLNEMGADKVFRSNLQFGGSEGNTVASHVSTASNLNAAFQNVTFYTEALGVDAISEYATAFPSAEATSTTIDGALFDYGFTTGEMVYGGTIEDPVTNAPGYTAVNGANGYGTAVHACGYGEIEDGENILNNGDWTLAMSVKSCDVENGILLALGGNGRTTTGRELRILSSSTSGKLSAAIAQTWDTSEPQNAPASLALTDLGDTTGSFHTLVAVYTKDDAKIKLYWDGVNKGEFNSLQGMAADKVFRSFFQFGDSVNGQTYPSINHVPTAWCPDAAFQDVRFYTEAFDADKALAYALEFPAVAAATSAIDDVTFRHDFTGGTLEATGDGWTDSGLAGTGTAVEGVPDGAAFPSKDGYGTVVDGLSRDWTMAMQFRGPEVEEGKAVIFSYGGIETSGRRSISICRTAEGKLVAQTVQNWGSGVNATSSIELGDDADRLFHTLVIVNERNIKSEYEWGWASGMQSFYLDGKFAGAISDGNGQERALMDTFRYGAIYNQTFDGITEPTAESGLAFRDLRFAAKVWTSAEAKAYALDRQLAGEDYLFDYRFTSGAKHFYGDGLSDFVTTAAGYTPVNGTDGYGTAVHACGYGAIPDGGSILNNGDWTLATSFKSCAVSNGVILALGGDGRATDGRELRILSSSVPGELLLGVVQTYSYGGKASAYQNMPASLQLTDLGDTTGSFHSLVLVFTASDKILKAYWDGEYKGEFNSAQGMGTLFRSWLQFGQAKNSVLGYNSEDGTNYTLVNPAIVHVPTAYHPDVAFQDVRLFGKALGDEEIAAYTTLFPAAEATKSDIDGYGFRHDFSSGRLAVSGEGYIDGDGEGADGIVGTGVKVPGPRLDGKYTKAAFPSKEGYGTIEGGLNRDWTIAMCVKGPSVASGNPAAMFSFGGVEDSENQCRSIALCSSSTGSLFVQMVQNWGDGVNAPASLDLGGDVADGKFHTIVVVNERNIKNTDDPSYTWNTGMLSFYLDGEYKGSFTDKNGQERVLMDMIRYGAIYNRTHESVVEPGEESGLAFYDLRFIPQVWTGAEAADYSAAFPVAEQAGAPGFTIFLQ